jgi:YfiR/HmsC-like
MPTSWRRALVLAGLLATTLDARGAEIREYQAKAAFLVNFAKFIDWPAEAFDAPAAPLVVCVAGEKWLLGEIAPIMSGVKVGGRELRLQPAGSGTRCHLAFVAATASPQAAGVDSFTVKVGETDDFLQGGGHITLYFDRDLLRFEIAVQTVQQARFRMSAQLLALSKPKKR